MEIHSPLRHLPEDSQAARVAVQKIKSMKLKPIGTIHSPYKDRKECPPQGREEICEIEISGQYGEGLKDIDGFFHLILLYWLHSAKAFSLLVKTPWDSKPHGLFATRSPNRPNPIGFSVVDLIEINGNRLKVKSLDALEGTPLLDIKPYLPEIDAKSNVRIGWVKNTDFSKVYGSL
jgi:tRNA-Thr(GGU) m(6)t(6)A37 methyltransferase TsaA